jgi:CRP-like cAMP-binding protein
MTTSMATCSLDVIRESRRQVKDLKLRTAAQRLGCYLLARAKDPEQLPFNQRLLAARLSCCQENLSRALTTSHLDNRLGVSPAATSSRRNFMSATGAAIESAA